MPAPESTAEHLKTGWDPETSNHDTVMRQIILAIAEDSMSKMAAFGGKVRRTDHFLAADLGEPASLYNSATLLHPLSTLDAEAVMSDLHDFFAIDGNATGMCTIFSLWQLPDLRPWGWSLMGHPPAHYLPVGNTLPADPPGVSFSRVSTSEELSDWEAGARQSFADDLPAGVLSHPSELDDPQRHMWIARVDGQVAGIASSTTGAGVTYISMVGTVPAFRRLGIGTALTWRAALADPASPACLLSSDEGRLTYDRMGFLPLMRCTLWYRLRG